MSDLSLPPTNKNLKDSGARFAYMAPMSTVRIPLSRGGMDIGEWFIELGRKQGNKRTMRLVAEYYDNLATEIVSCSMDLGVAATVGDVSELYERLTGKQWGQR